MKKLFTNSIEINSNLKTVTDILVNAFTLAKWNYAISEVTEVSVNEFAIHRDEPAINQDEIMTVEQNDNEVAYVSKGGKLEYQLTFQTFQTNNHVLVTENFYILNDFSLPETLILPITKRAFNQNLKALKKMIEV
ncbi:hypothetical protein [Companilactobacillus bobalius]|uniref:SRPBCC family protein n=2 Tax=Companilactobacillus bobalius TaxID=2801451 RepID=A0A202F857_9LACO|nr:hypothetical protein [Companilactobacillus bobalius]GEO58393.1 hypothetical protein LBO01_15220 [Companilactobacillus paralimentarius]KAE9557653.1 hypothetical protein ATN92_16000 [Companilactobacillus bobalius]KAE9563799.1 hypothetical protein ATN92_03450 [Companilactobacillus bobalius]KRK83545.1 hypothetical protein FC78_GL001502 [Companilactobacillus bobalius DSM 19674]OVE96628.1 hypothetical protein LKACC16343_02297 [Companilactobacillus bobalius]